MACIYCDQESDYCDIYQDSLTNDWYLHHRTGEWNDYDDDFVWDKIYIDYCPWCGRKLEEEK